MHTISGQKIFLVLRVDDDNIVIYYTLRTVYFKVRHLTDHEKSMSH